MRDSEAGEGARPRDPSFQEPGGCACSEVELEARTRRIFIVRSLANIRTADRGDAVPPKRGRAEKRAESGLPILNHQIELVDKAVDFFEIFTTALFRFDIERATKSDHVAQVADGILGKVWGLGFGER